MNRYKVIMPNRLKARVAADLYLVDTEGFLCFYVYSQRNEMQEGIVTSISVEVARFSEWSCVILDNSR